MCSGDQYRDGQGRDSGRTRVILPGDDMNHDADMLPYHTIPNYIILYHTIPYQGDDKMLTCNTIPYHTIPYQIISYHTIPG